MANGKPDPAVIEEFEIKLQEESQKRTDLENFYSNENQDLKTNIQGLKEELNQKLESIQNLERGSTLLQEGTQHILCL